MMKSSAYIEQLLRYQVSDVMQHILHRVINGSWPATYARTLCIR